MAKDFQYCLDDLAALLSVRSITDLPANELAQVKSVLNDAYRECYIRPDGSRSRWSEQPVSAVLRGPTEITLTLTKDGTAITAPSIAPSASDVGASILIDGLLYTYAGKTAADVHHLAEPFAGESGEYVATLYHNAVALPAGTIDMLDEPQLVGAHELEAKPRINDVLGTQTGEPEVYFVDSAPFSPGGEIQEPTPRVLVYPMPASGARMLRARVSFVPDSIGADLTKTPMIPLGAVDDILLPIARAKLVMLAKRYSGANKAEIVQAGRIAQGKLDSIASPQRNRALKISVKRGF